MQIRVERMDRPEEALTGSEARQVNGAGPNIICGARGCFVAPPTVFAAPPYPVFGSYAAYPAYGFAPAPFYSPFAPAATFAPSYFPGVVRYW